MTVFVLWLTFFMTNGSVMTHGVVNDSMFNCKTFAPIIVEDYKKEYKDKLRYLSFECRKEEIPTT